MTEPEVYEEEQKRPAGTLIHTRQDREQAVRSWLLLSAPSVDEARQEWEKGGIALLRCGALFAAVRIDANLIHTAAGTDEPEQVNAFLAEALLGGPVFADQHTRRYYALVPASTPGRREWRERRHPGAECLGREPYDSYLGVPRPESNDADRHFSYWCVPMEGPGDLCDADAVSKFVSYARHRLAMKEAHRGG